MMKDYNCSNNMETQVSDIENSITNSLLIHKEQEQKRELSRFILFICIGIVIIVCIASIIYFIITKK